MRASLIVGCGLLVAVGGFGCGDSSGSGGAGGSATTATASVTATTTAHTTGATSSSSTKATSANNSTTSTGAGAPISCNPVNDTQCDPANGFNCDLKDPLNSGFICYNGPSTIALCQACIVNSADAECLDGLSCLPTDASITVGKCAKYCCTDVDCGGGAGSCAYNLGLFSGDMAVGFCITKDPTNTFMATCNTNAPAVAPSNGSCYTPPNP